MQPTDRSLKIFPSRVKIVTYSIINETHRVVDTRANASYKQKWERNRSQAIGNDLVVSFEKE